MNKLLFILFSFTLIHICEPSLLLSQKAKFSHLSVDQGLSHNSVHSIVQDQNGFMWFATGDGLNRFDGYSFRVFKNDPKDSNSIYSNSLRCLYLDKDSMIWIGFNNGTIDHFNSKTNQFTHFYLPSPSGKGQKVSGITCITENKSNLLFIATDEDGIFILDKKTGSWQNMRNDKNNSNSLSSNNVTKIAFDKQGVLWCATWGSGVVSWNPSTLKFTQFSNLNSLNIYTLYPGQEGEIWVSAWNSGINCIDPVSGKVISNFDTSCYLHKQLPYGLVSGFIEDRNGLLWLSSAEKGIIKYDRKIGKATVFNKDPDDLYSLSDNLVLSLSEDKSGLIWCGTWQGGINIYNPQKQLMEHYYFSSNDPESLINNVVWSLSKSKNDKLWIATSGGVCSFDPETHKFNKLEYNKFDHEAPEEQTIIHSVIEDVDGQIWLGSNGAGLFRYNPSTKKYRHYYYDKNPESVKSHFSGLSGQTVKALMLDKKNNLWIVTRGGGLNLYDRDKDKFIYYLNKENDPKSISSNNISTIIESKDGKIWVATVDAGLNLLNPVSGKAERFVYDPENNNSLLDNKLTALHIDKSGILWIGTKSGVCSYSNGKFISFTEKDGLPDNFINSIETDDAGNLWLATNKGILRYSATTKKVKTYDVNDGVQSNQFKINSSCKTKDGYIYFGGVKGINRFNPRLLTDNLNPPKLVFTGFNILNMPYQLKEDILATKEIILSYKDYFFSFEFAGLEFTNTAKNKYKYILEGFNEDWIDIGTTRSLTFTNLDPGEYTLSIKACNNDGLWSDNTSMRIVITPPFWKTKWFYAVCILLLIFCVYIYIKYREKKLMSEKLVLENKVEVRTRELKEEKVKVEEAHKEITDSIHYAKRIQRALLASGVLLKKNLPEYFILYKPKDIVSGDFYWAHSSANNSSHLSSSVPHNSLFYIVTADCTGHGVPGAFMSLLNISKLSETVNEKKITKPDLILGQVREEIIKALNPEGAEIESKDGMDCVLCAFDFNKMELQFVAANNPLWLIRNNELIEYKPDKIPVGISHGELKPFSLQTINLLKNDIVYTFTDGYADQFGGEKEKKFKNLQLKELLLANSHLSMQEQKIILNRTIEKWKGNLEQVDDILIIGIKI